MAKKLEEKKIKEIKFLYDNGMKNREIARELNIHHRTVSNYLKRWELKSNGYISQPIEMINDYEAKCSKCGEIKPLAEFQHGRKGQKYEYRFSFCNDCRNKQTYLNLNLDIKKWFRNNTNRIKRRAKKEKIDFDLDYMFLYEMYEKQKGLCFYTDCKLEWLAGKGIRKNSLSIDKIDHLLGYTKDNIVLCSKRINTMKLDATLEEMKLWMPDWYNRILKHKEKINE